MLFPRKLNSLLKQTKKQTNKLKPSLLKWCFAPADFSFLSHWENNTLLILTVHFITFGTLKFSSIK